MAYVDIVTALAVLQFIVFGFKSRRRPGTVRREGAGDYRQ